MLFSSPTFFAFFAVYFLFHLLLPAKYRLYLIICGSTVFYAWWKLEYAWLPYLLAGIAYFGMLWIERATLETARRRRAAATIVLLFVPLVFFKYSNFLYADVLGFLFGEHGKLLDLSLPLGVSFVTFTLTAYVVDTYRGKFPPNATPLTVLGYVLFFPHLIAGPILRPIELIPQLQHPRRAKSLRPVSAITLFTVGLVKKLVVADQIGAAVDAVYGHAGLPSGPEALLAMYGFSAQIYCDFSGYTDMAIALAMLLGIRLPNNFEQPYCASSIIDFWRRWHMTLSFWLRDYLYIPLGGNRSGKLNELRNIMITMALGGLWHGASWTFVIWGIVHGLAVSAVHAAKEILRWKWLERVPRWATVLVTFHFVTLAWVFFRAPGLRRAGEILSAPLLGSWTQSGGFVSAHAFEILLLALFFLLHQFDDHRRVRIAAARLRPEILWPGLAALWAISITVSQGSSAKFIYFDF
jgi:alginate O-acetyltransferase complex protein AlgI